VDEGAPRSGGEHGPSSTSLVPKGRWGYTAGDGGRRKEHCRCDEGASRVERIEAVKEKSESDPRKVK